VEEAEFEDVDAALRGIIVRTMIGAVRSHTVTGTENTM
jgi:hypothetical protein